MFEIKWGIYFIQWNSYSFEDVVSNQPYYFYFECSNFAEEPYFRGLRYSKSLDKLYLIKIDNTEVEASSPLDIKIYRTTQVDDALRGFFFQSVYSFLPMVKLSRPKIFYENGVVTFEPTRKINRVEILINGIKVREQEVESLLNISGTLIQNRGGFILQQPVTFEPSKNYLLGLSTHRNYEESPNNSINSRFGYMGSYNVVNNLTSLNSELKPVYLNRYDFFDVWWIYNNSNTYNKFVGDYIDEVYLFPSRIVLNTDKLPSGKLSIRFVSDDERFEPSENSDEINYKSSFFLRFYNSNCEPTVVEKTNYLVELSTRVGTFREETSILNPSIEVESEEIPVGNYAYVGYFDRYYFITNITSVRKNLWRVDMSVDVLMTNRLAIQEQVCLVSRNEFEWNPFIIDNYVKADETPFVEELRFTDVFHSTVMVMDDIKRYTWSFEYVHYLITNVNVKVGVEYPDTSLNYGQPNILKSNTVYYFNAPEEYGKFEEGVLNPDFWATVGDLFQNHADFWTAAFSIPFDFIHFYETLGGESNGFFDITVNNTNVIMGGQTVGYTDDDAWKIARRVQPSSRLRMWCRLPKERYSFDDFLDREPYCKYQLYIPFIGIVDVASAYLKEGYDILLYDIDITTGDLCACLVNSKNYPTVESEYQLYRDPLTRYPYLWEGNAYIELKMGRTNKNELARNALIGGIKVGLSAISAGATEAASGAVIGALAATGNVSPLTAQSIESSWTMKEVSSGVEVLGGLATTLLSLNPSGSARGGNEDVLKARQSFIPRLFKTKINYYYPQNYNHLFGRPLYTTKRLAEVHGFTVVETFHPVGFNCTADELDKIEQLLLNGVILP